TNNNRPTVQGTAEPGATVVVTGSGTGGSGVASATGQYSIVLNGRTLTIPAGQTQTTFAVPILGDTVLEANNETFTTTLANVVGATLTGGRGIGNGLIVDDETAGQLSVGDITVQEPTTGSVNATFTVYLS